MAVSLLEPSAVGLMWNRGLRNRTTVHAPDSAIAIPEDLVAIGLGLLLVSRF
jgi:hypothetical protein